MSLGQVTPIRILKRIAKNLIRKSGFEIRRTSEIPSGATGLRHAEVFPAATYSPWLADEEFEGVYEVIKGHTLVDRYRCYELWQLVGEAAKLRNGALIEVGVWRGGTGALIAAKCQLVGIQDTVYLCDTFKGVVKAGPKDAVYRGGEHADTTQASVIQLMNRLQLGRVQILEGIFPDESSDPIRDHQFRLCHIDVDVYESAKDIADWIWPRLVPGGIVVYDDYGFHSCPGITQFVNEERRKADRTVIHNLNGHAVVIKMSSALGQTAPSSFESTVSHQKNSI